MLKGERKMEGLPYEAIIVKNNVLMFLTNILKILCIKHSISVKMVQTLIFPYFQILCDEQILTM